MQLSCCLVGACFIFRSHEREQILPCPCSPQLRNQKLAICDSYYCTHPATFNVPRTLKVCSCIVSHLLDQTDAAQGGDGPRCPVGRLLRQGGEASIPHSLQTLAASRSAKVFRAQVSQRKFHIASTPYSSQARSPLRSSSEPFGSEAGFALAGLRSGSP